MLTTHFVGMGTRPRGPRSGKVGVTGMNGRPIIRAGAGTVYTTETVPPGETRYNFSLFVGAGIEFATFDDKAIQIDYRLHHISNADSGAENPGINAHTVVVGLAWGF